VRIRDFGDGMSLRTMSNATEYLFTSAAETYEQQQQQMQQSYQPAMEPMQGMGIGLPVSRLYARHWGGGEVLARKIRHGEVGLWSDSYQGRRGGGGGVF
jgi:signal transduction histidine kinase